MMTETEAVAVLRKAARQNRCTLREDMDSRVRHSHQFDDGFVVGWDAEHRSVTFFAFSKSPVDPPREVLEAFRGVQKVHIRAAKRDLTWLEYMKDVRCLEVYNWENQQFPVQCKNLEASLESLYLMTLTGKIPVQIRRFGELRSLGLDSPNPLELPAWLAQLTRLDRLLLRGCTIKEIPETLTRMGLPFVLSDAGSVKLRGIFLDGAKLLEGDIKLYRRSPQEIEAYYQKLRTRERIGNQGKAAKPAPECMVVFLGDGSAGKTSLIDRIVHPEKEFIQGAALPTNGIKMERWPQAKQDNKDSGSGEETGSPPNQNDESLERLLSGDPLVLRLRDFGGQEIMYSLHRCFMSSHTVYVVVCESRMDADIDINAARWVETVLEFAPESPVILALNKADLNPNVSVNFRDLKKRNPSLKCVLQTSANPEYPRSKDSIEELMRVIIREARGCADKYPAGADWLAVKKTLEDMNADYIKSSEYQEICEQNHIYSEEDQRAMLDWFRDLGIVYSYSENKQEVLDDKLHVLNPEWLSNGMYRIILRAPEGGFPTFDEIEKTLRTVHPDDISPVIYESKPNADEPKFIIDVMRQFGISRQLNEHRELIPVRLVKTPPEQIDDFHRETALHLRWEGNYLPNNLVHQLIIRKFEHLRKNPEDKKYCVWRTGGWFLEAPDSLQGNQALVEMNERHLDLYVAPGSRQNGKGYLREMRDTILDLLWELNLRSVKEWLFWKGAGRVEYKSVMDQYVGGGESRDVFISGVNEYVKPRRILETFYENTDELVATYRLQEGLPGGTQDAPQSMIPHPTGHSLLDLWWELWDVYRANPWLGVLPGLAIAGVVGSLFLF